MGRRVPVERDHLLRLHGHEAHVVGALQAGLGQRIHVDLEGAAHPRLDAGIGCEEAPDALARRPGFPGLVERRGDLDLLVDAALRRDAAAQGAGGDHSNRQASCNLHDLSSFHVFGRDRCPAGCQPTRSRAHALDGPGVTRGPRRMAVCFRPVAALRYPLEWLRRERQAVPALAFDRERQAGLPCSASVSPDAILTAAVSSFTCGSTVARRPSAQCQRSVPTHVPAQPMP